jgi:hypothetical protein
VLAHIYQDGYCEFSGRLTFFEEKESIKYRSGFSLPEMRLEEM